MAHTETQALSWLVIGGTGLVGQYLLRRLAFGGHEVAVVTRDPKSVPSPARAIVADVSQVGWLDNIDPTAYNCIVHMAYAITGEAEYDRVVTANSVEDILKHFRNAQLTHFVLVGSMCVFGMDLPSGLLDERLPRVPDSEYARNKIDAACAANGADVGFPISVLHPTNVYAKGSKRLKSYAEILSQGYFLFRAGGQGINNIVHADDVAAAIVGAVNRSLGDRVEEYIVNGEMISYAQWLKALESYFGVGGRSCLPTMLAPICRGPVRRFLAMFGFRSPILLPDYKSAMFECKAALSSEKARSHFGWCASHCFSELMDDKGGT